MRLLVDLLNQARARDPEDFQAEFDCPVLVFEPFASSENSPTFQTVELLGGGPLGAAVVAMIRKREGSTDFPRMITLGRAASNDIAVKVESISKFHGYFVEVKGEMLWADANSANGSTVDGVALEARQKTPVRSGSKLNFGEVEATYYDPPALYEFLVSR